MHGILLLNRRNNLNPNSATIKQFQKKSQKKVMQNENLTISRNFILIKFQGLRYIKLIIVHIINIINETYKCHNNIRGKLLLRNRIYIQEIADIFAIFLLIHAQMGFNYNRNVRN